MSTIRTACSERSAGGERGGDGEETLERIVIRKVVIVFVIVVGGGRRSGRKRFKSDESGKRQIGVSGVEGERVWKRAGGSAAAGCWGHFFLSSFFFLFFFGMDFWEGLEVIVIFFLNLYLDGFWWELGILMFVVVDVCFVLLFLFRLLNPGHVRIRMPEAEVKWNTVGWK